MKNRRAAVVLFSLALIATAAWAFWEKSPEQERAEIDQMKAQTLNDLYRLRPESKTLLKEAAGFAVFSTKGAKILVAGSTSGKGVLVENESGRKVYMKMLQINVGLGYGLQNARLVFVFQDRRAMEGFATQGWDFSGKADAEAAAQGQGGGAAGAVSLMPGVLVYQFTDTGLAASITLGGTKFWAEKKWN